MKPPFWMRYVIIGAIMIAISVGIIFQMLRIQNQPSAEFILASNEGYQGVTRTIYPDRGNIYDRWGHLLAGNETTYEVNIFVNEVINAETIATVSASILGLDYQTIYGYAGSDEKVTNIHNYTIANFVPTGKIEQLAILYDQYENLAYKRNRVNPSLRGLTWSPITKRSYPEATLASNLLGFYKFRDIKDGLGYYGVEGAYNDVLSGLPETIYKPYDPQLVEAIPEVPSGTSLILTIDREIQSMSESVLDKAIDWSGAESGTIIVYDPKDGSILSMATSPRLDPNEYWNIGSIFPGETPYNRAISKVYEPGSIFKVITMAAALDAGAVTPTTHFYDPGYIEVGGYYINNWDGGAWGDQDMTGCMQHSLNVCLSWIALELGADNFYNYLRDFGFDRNTGIDLGGETHLRMRVPGDENWYKVDLATNSFGQGIAVTPIQMVMAAGALANEGKMMSPHVVKSLLIDGNQYEINPVVVGSPIKSETARTITEMLANSLEFESSNALVEGYRLAGKTGTAEIPTPYGYTSGQTHTSFIGWGPVDDPQFLVYVWLEKPSISIWGSEVAAPVFKEVVEKLVILMDLPPDRVRQALAVQE